jgi:hypothetical protein
MQEFMFLFRGGAPAPNASPAEMQRHLQKWRTWIEGLSKQGKFRAGEPLEAASKVARSPNKIVTDGPFAESKEGASAAICSSSRAACKKPRKSPGAARSSRPAGTWRSAIMKMTM